MAIGSTNAPGKSYSPATQSSDGLMSAADKTKLDGIDAVLNQLRADIIAGAVTLPLETTSGEAMETTSGAALEAVRTF